MMSRTCFPRLCWRARYRGVRLGMSRPVTPLSDNTEAQSRASTPSLVWNSSDRRTLQESCEFRSTPNTSWRRSCGFKAAPSLPVPPPTSNTSYSLTRRRCLEYRGLGCEPAHGEALDERRHPASESNGGNLTITAAPRHGVARHIFLSQVLDGESDLAPPELPHRP
jgi:hypothetical protein